MSEAIDGLKVAAQEITRLRAELSEFRDAAADEMLRLRAERAAMLAALKEAQQWLDTGWAHAAVTGEPSDIVEKIDAAIKAAEGG